LEQGILPHADVRIYVPLRIFKAIAQSKYYADAKVFSNNQFYKEMMIGMCDSGKCAPRDNPLKMTSMMSLNNSVCPGSKSFWFIPDVEKNSLKNWKASFNVGSLNVIPYNPDETASMQDALKIMIGRELCSDAESPLLIDVDEADGLNLVKDETGCNLYGNTVSVETVPSKTIKFSGIYDQPQFEDRANCTRATEIKARIRFEETNPKYKVNKNNKNVYTVEVLDSYSSSDLDPNSPANICWTNCDEQQMGMLTKCKCETTKKEQ
jgi:hypothetical protein